MPLSSNARRLILKVKNACIYDTQCMYLTIRETQSQCSCHLVVKLHTFLPLLFVDVSFVSFFEVYFEGTNYLKIFCSDLQSIFQLISELSRN